MTLLVLFRPNEVDTDKAEFARVPFGSSGALTVAESSSHLGNFHTHGTLSVTYSRTFTLQFHSHSALSVEKHGHEAAS